jgi:hypothetical protein
MVVTSEKGMASLKLPSEQQWILECYWNTKNVVEAQRDRNESKTPPPTWVTITRLCDKFQTARTCRKSTKADL